MTHSPVNPDPVARVAAGPGLRLVQDVSREQELFEHLDALGVPLFITLGPGLPEYRYPSDWQTTDPSTNWDRIERFTDGDAVCAVGCDAVAFVDVDPQNGASVDDVRALLEQLGVRIYYEDRTPGGGAHFGVAGHPELPTVSGQKGLPGWPGVEIKSHGSHVYLPGTRRPKYDGAGYYIIEDNLEALADGGDTDSAEALVNFVAAMRGMQHQDPAPAAPPWDGSPLSSSQRAWIDSTFRHVVAELEVSPPGQGDHGGRNNHLNQAAWRLGKFVAGAGLDEQTVIAALERACDINGLTAEDGIRSVRATIASGLRSGKARPQAAPVATVDPLDDFIARMREPHSDAGAPVAMTATEASIANSAAEQSTSRRQEVVAQGGATDQPDDPEARAHRLFEAGVAFELEKLRIREEARARLRREQAAGISIPPRISLTDFLAQPDPPIAYRIDRLHPIGGRSLLAAQKKAGKTTFIGNLMRCLVDGGDFLGRFTVSPLHGRVALIDNELHETTLRRWLRDYNITNTGAIDVHPLRGKVSTFNILDPDIRTRWAADLRAANTNLVVLDCLRPFLDALGLNEHTEAGQFLVAFDELLSEAGVDEAVVVHHMGHSGERSRGDSRIGDWADANWKIVREDAEDDASTRYFSAFGRDVDIREGRLAFDKHSRALTFAPTSRTDAKVESALLAIVDILANSTEGLSANAIEMAANDLAEPLKRAAVRGALKRGIEIGLLAVSPGERNSKIHRLANTCRTCGKPMSGGQAFEHLTCIEEAA
ncbi:AAA family ATPase [Gordonia hongkongensis]|uniref:AAA family ATPase n=1 Tax=Gordonia hongkongensis TaxID=1701090 RepID=A0AAX3T8N1_9ACTN|nr:AAA family ATPase [Gordonia hongkongensis]QIK49644.1 AAA family ATPase [Gordonia terrae]WFP25424.1 AAA family ATPase [Gordonia hongkongensis]